LINGVTLQLQREKEYKIQEGHQNILEEFEVHQEDVHAKYDGIISKTRVIKYQSKRIEDDIVSQKKINEMCVQNKGKPSYVKPYRRLITMKYFKEDNKIYIIIINEEDGILINIRGT
jgi:hypothetical protein